MKENIILLIIGLMVLLIPLILLLFLKEKRINKNEKLRQQNKETKLQENTISNIENQLMIERIKKLEGEVSQLIKNKNKPVHVEDGIKDINPIKDDFKPILNRNIFKETNSPIIDLYEKGKSNNDIAKILNKSIREVEMVVNLVK